MRSSVLLLACTLAAASAAAAHAEDFVVDPVHTRVAFLVGHAGFSKAIGTFAGATGTLSFDPDHREDAKLEISLPVASLNLGDAEWREKVLDRTYFDGPKFPQARFVSTAVKPLEGDKLHVTGNLTIHGVTQAVEFDATFNQLKRHPLTFRRTAGFSARLTVSRKAFGMSAWPSVIDDSVEILVELEATKAKLPTPGEVPTAPAPTDADAPADEATIPPEDAEPPAESETPPAADDAYPDATHQE
jgi:polyisoprenoid-binding protein YceI